MLCFVDDMADVNDVDLDDSIQVFEGFAPAVERFPHNVNLFDHRID